MIKPMKCLLAAAAIFSLASAANAATVVKVTLWDKGLEAGMAEGLQMNMSGADMSQATMGVTAEPAKVKAGEITFEATNASKEIIHEMLIVPAQADGELLPYVTNESRVDEDAAHHLGEVSELDPGKSGALTVTLEPGHYVLFCNIPGHFNGGMWTTFTVEP